MDSQQPPHHPTMMPEGPINVVAPNSTIIMPPATVRFPFDPVPPPPQPQPPANPSSEPFIAKKKRGRPRKYTPEGIVALGLAPTQAPSSAVPNGVGGTPSAEASAKKKQRGRPPGSVKKQLDALGTAGSGFTPSVLIVDSGEDIITKIMAFCMQGLRTVCILSANGTVRNVTLRQPISGGTATYEGRFDIISLSGSLQQYENNGEITRKGGFSVSLVGSEGRVFGGGVAGMLTAQSPIQVIIASFIAKGKKSSSNIMKSGPSSAPPSQILTSGAPTTPTSATTQGPSAESSEEHDHTPFSMGPGHYNNVSQPVHNIQMYPNPHWVGQTHQ